MFDTHVHTEYSSDSNMKIEEALKAAEYNNLSLTFTEHMDIKYPKKGDFTFNVEDYFREYSKFRGDKLLLGIEIGMKEDAANESRSVVLDNKFDYVIGSIHLVDNMDLYYPEYYKDKSKEEAYSEYLKTMFGNFKQFDFVDSLAHIDYICRYAKYDDKELYYREFCDIIDEILKLIIDRGKCLELNTRRLDNKEAIYSIINIYKRYMELGGKYITVGSDAHNPQTIGNNFDIATEIAQNCNLKIVHFKNRSMEY